MTAHYSHIEACTRAATFITLESIAFLASLYTLWDPRLSADVLLLISLPYHQEFSYIPFTDAPMISVSFPNLASWPTVICRYRRPPMIVFAAAIMTFRTEFRTFKSVQVSLLSALSFIHRLTVSGYIGRASERLSDDCMVCRGTVSILAASSQFPCPPTGSNCGGYRMRHATNTSVTQEEGEVQIALLICATASSLAIQTLGIPRSLFC